MSKSAPYFIALLVITITANLLITHWLNPRVPPDNTQLEQVLTGIKQQSASITALENSLKQLNSDISRVEAKTQQQDSLATSIDELQIRLEQLAVNTLPVEKTESAPEPAPVFSDTQLTEIDQQFADLQQQLDILLANQNRRLPEQSQNNTIITPDPYAGMDPQQAKQLRKEARQQELQQLSSIISTTSDFSRTTEISSHFESHWSDTNITNPPPKVDCNTSLCHFQFDKETLSTKEGEQLNPVHVLMQSGAFPSDGVKRRITTQINAQGGMDLYVGKKESFNSNN